ncbi:PREDICTED: neurofilament medium polypeptide-like [Rhagoletis zephyria]|uniref:neurofilament medium polypeptide-like n=1 Tax=Rhagoletis zephyria TaxID=28612 RepID=UPI000811963C|nr:PREDICTED: neurofilament medium polypeptide-like [Rhagoletis zephyria]
MFYTKFIEKTPIEATPEQVRWKVRHLKSLYVKANDSLNSTGAGVLEGEESIEGRILKICPHYRRLQNIFEPRGIALRAPLLVTESPSTELPWLSTEPPWIELPSTESPPAIATLASVSPTLSSTITQLVESEVPSPRSPSLPVEEALIPSSSTPKQSGKTKARPRSAMGQLATIQKERMQFESEKLKVKKEAVDIEKKRLDIDEKRAENDKYFREKELDFKYKELEMKERIAKYEIDKKYGT